MDRVTPEQRSRNMALIKDKDTKIEVKVRKYLFNKGFRYRKNDRRYPGKPDVVLPKYKTIIFVNGCFWHMHSGCKRANLPKSRQNYWRPKLLHNVENDHQHYEDLKNAGWHVIVLWECELNKNFDSVMEQTTEEILTMGGSNDSKTDCSI